MAYNEECDDNFYDITDSSSGGGITIDDPESHGYTLLQNDFSEDEWVVEECATEIDQRQYPSYGRDYDESEKAESTASSDDSSSGKIESGSRELFGPLERKLEVSHDYDEEHLVNSSSSETSPRDDVDSMSTPIVGDNRIKYSRHIAPQRTPHSGSSSAPTAVDTGISFANLSSVSSLYGPRYNYSEFNKPSMSTYPYNKVTGMAVRPQVKPDDVRLQMPDDESSSSFRPGGALHKSTTSSFTRDSSPMMRRLDNRQRIEMQPLSSSSGQSRDYSEFGNVSSLEHQHPDNSTSTVESGTSDDATTSRTHLTGGGRAGQSCGTTSSSASAAEPNNELNKKKQRKIKKVNKEENSWTTADSEVGKMEINDILAFIGEKNANTESGKKKKEKKGKEATNVEKKKEKGNTNTITSSNNRRKDNASSASKKRHYKSAATDNVLAESPNSQFSVPTSEIIQTTSNDRLVSRILLNGSDDCLDSSGSSAMPTFSERNIDEAIEQRKSLATEAKLDSELVDTTTETEDVNFLLPTGSFAEESSSANELVCEPDVELINPTTSQTVSVTYNIDLASQPFMVEEEFVRIKTPESVEEEFKPVVHKKKKGHTKQSMADKDNSCAPSVPVITNKPVHKIAVKPKPIVARPISPTRKMSDSLKEKPSAVGEMQCDFSEKSFPMLSGDHKPRVATVLPFCSSWASKVASSSLVPTVQQQAVGSVIGDGDHCIDNESFPLPSSSASSNVTNKKKQSTDESAVEREVVCSQSISLDGDAPAQEEKVADLVQPVEVGTDVSTPVAVELPLEASCKPPAVNAVEPFAVRDNVDKPSSTEECVCAPPITTQARGPRASKKSSKVVEFVGRSFQESRDSPSSNIQFGFGFDTEQSNQTDFEFGISQDILRQTSLKPQSQPEVDHIAVSGVSIASNLPIDILPRLLASKSPAVDYVNGYPPSLRKVVHMLKKDWNMTLHHLKMGTVGQYSKKKVVRWSANLI